MEDLLKYVFLLDVEGVVKLVFFLIVAVVWVVANLAKKVKDEQQRRDTPHPRKPEEDDGVYVAGRDEVSAFLEQMGVARPVPRPKPAVRKPKPAPVKAAPKPQPEPEPEPTPARSVLADVYGQSGPKRPSSAADALRAAAARRMGRQRVGAGPVSLRKEPRSEPAATIRTVDERKGFIFDETSGLPFMQRAVILREILGPPPGLSSDPFRGEM